MLKPTTGLVLILLASQLMAKGGRNKAFILPDDTIAEQDMIAMRDILPTMYYTPEEDKVDCAGKYGRVVYKGTEKSNVLGLDGKVIAKVCTKFAKTLLMEGSGILKDRGEGNLAINYGGKVNKVPRYFPLERCKFGEGIKRDLCLLPYYTIAADNDHHMVDDIIFVPEAKGIQLPDGTTHEGFFIVRDTGGAFNRIGAQRVDLFTGTDPDFANAFQLAGFHHKRPMTAFKISGDSAERVKEKLLAKFGELY